MLRVIPHKDTVKLKQQIEALKHAINTDSNEKDRQIHKEALEILVTELNERGKMTMNNDFTYETIDAECKLMAFEFSKYDEKTQNDILKFLGKGMELIDVEMRWDIETGNTILNKESCMYDVCVEMLPVLMKMSDDGLDRAELRYEKEFREGGDSFLDKCIRYIFDDEKRRRLIFAKAEKEVKDKQQALEIIDLLGKQPIFQGEYDESVTPVFISELCKRYKSADFLLYSTLFSYGFIQGKRAERARRKKT